MIDIQGTIRTVDEIRRTQYENIIDEALYISRASDGSVSADWIMNQPIFIRKKYYKAFTEEMKKREAEMKKHSSKS